MDEDTMFASRSVPVHVVRGVLGAVLLVASFVLAAQAHPAFVLLLVPAGFAFRGCPTCWAMGLGQTIARQKRATTTPDAEAQPYRRADVPGT